MAIPLISGLIRGGSALSGTVRAVGSARVVGALNATGRGLMSVVNNKYLAGVSNAATVVGVTDQLFLDEELIPEEVEALLIDISSVFGIAQGVQWINSSGIGSAVAAVASARSRKLRKYLSKYPRPQSVKSDLVSRKPADLVKSWPKMYDKKTETWLLTNQAGEGLFRFSKDGFSFAEQVPLRVRKARLAGGTTAAAASLFAVTDDVGFAEASDYIDFLFNIFADTDAVSSSDPGPDAQEASVGRGDAMANLSLVQLLRHPDWVVNRIAYVLDTSATDSRVNDVYAELIRRQIMGEKHEAPVTVLDSSDADLTEADFTSKVLQELKDANTSISSAFSELGSSIYNFFEFEDAEITITDDASARIDSSVDALNGDDNGNENSGNEGSARASAPAGTSSAFGSILSNTITN